MLTTVYENFNPEEHNRALISHESPMMSDLQLEPLDGSHFTWTAARTRLGL